MFPRPTLVVLNLEECAMTELSLVNFDTLFLAFRGFTPRTTRKSILYECVSRAYGVLKFSITLVGAYKISKYLYSSPQRRLQELEHIHTEPRKIRKGIYMGDLPRRKGIMDS